jgi:regulator of protease activity HflC (stomatin/prohibitin superfamily)
MILESSGKLEAKRNEADGQFYQEQRLSDAKKYAIEMQAKAVAIEIQTYAEAMKISAAEVRTGCTIRNFLKLRTNDYLHY